MDAPIKINMKQKPVPESAPLTHRLILWSVWFLFFAYTLVILLDTWIVPSNWCPLRGRRRDYPNPDSAAVDACYDVRSVFRLGLTPLECDFARRAAISLAYGSAIGYERKAVDRPAGIRTMSLVCLGACLFTLCGMFAFRDGPQGWDAARVSAAVPSGVGFLGSALIWKETQKNFTANGEGRHSVHGITTAASVWLSASVGIGAGGGLYLYCTWAVLLVLCVLRLGPQLAFLPLDDDVSYRGDADEWDTEWPGEELASSLPCGADLEEEEDDDGLIPPNRDEQLQLLLRQQAARQSSRSQDPDERTPSRRIPSVPSLSASVQSRRSRRSVRQIRADAGAVSLRS